MSYDIDVFAVHLAGVPVQTIISQSSTMVVVVAPPINISRILSGPVVVNSTTWEYTRGGYFTYHPSTFSPN